MRLVARVLARLALAGRPGGWPAPTISSCLAHYILHMMEFCFWVYMYQHPSHGSPSSLLPCHQHNTLLAVCVCSYLSFLIFFYYILQF